MPNKHVLQKYFSRMITIGLVPFAVALSTACQSTNSKVSEQPTDNPPDARDIATDKRSEEGGISVISLDEFRAIKRGMSQDDVERTLGWGIRSDAGPFLTYPAKEGFQYFIIFEGERPPQWTVTELRYYTGHRNYRVIPFRD